MAERKIPKYCHHKGSGQAYVRLNGRDIYLGVHGTPASRAEYDRLIARWLAGGRYMSEPGADQTISEVIAAYEAYAAGYYMKDGEPTSQIKCVRSALAVVRRLYGPTEARDFDSADLKAVRADMVEGGLARKTINQRINAIKLCFRWAAEEKLIEPSVWHGVQVVKQLEMGRTKAPEYPDVLPAPEAAITEALPHLSSVLADVVRVQLLTGARPGEVLALKACQLDRTGDVWLYRPPSHKTSGKRRERVIYIGPQCQLILAPYIERHPVDYLFCPKDALLERWEKERAARKTPVQPSQLNRTKARPRRTPGKRYHGTSYAHAVERACERAGCEKWHPHRLRHNAGTRLAQQFGWELARIVLGHRSIDVTRIYAEDSAEKAIAAIRLYG